MRPFLTAEWTNLVMANYEFDRKLLLQHLPAHTELDTHNGIDYISLVAFMFTNTKVLGIGFPFHRDFEEINLRFYVRFKDSGEWKRGVVFIKEIVPRFAIALIANTLYGEHYQTLKTAHTWEFLKDEISLEYRWRFKNKWNHLRATGSKEKIPLLKGSEEEFIAEHYWGYTRVNALKMSEYEVKHPTWNIHPLKNYDIQCDFGALYGQEFTSLETAKPKSVFIADGSAISVMGERKL